MGRTLGVRAEPDDTERRVRAEDELPRQHGLRAEVCGSDLLRKILRAGNSGHRARRGQLDRERTGGSRADWRDWLVERLDSFDSTDRDQSGPLQGGGGGRGGRGKGERLGQRRFRRIVWTL